MAHLKAVHILFDSPISTSLSLAERGLLYCKSVVIFVFLDISNNALCKSDSRRMYNSRDVLLLATKASGQEDYEWSSPRPG